MTFGGIVIQFEKACTSDIDAILAAKKDAWVNEVKLYGHGPENYLNKDFFANLFKTHNIYKILNNDKIIGGLTCVNTGGNDYYIGSVFVIRSFQNKHIGTEAMEFLFRDIPNAKLWRLNTPYLSYGNHHFYEKLGFKKVGESEPDNTGFYLYYYEKKMSTE